MKANIHPKWNRDAVVTCNCGNTFTTGAINKTIQVDICSECHPFFTGEMRFVDRQGRVDKFMAKMKKAKTTKGKSGKKAKKAQAAEEKDDVKSYRELLREQQSSMRKADKDAKAEEDKTEDNKKN